MTKKKVKKTQKNKKTGAKRVVEKEVDDESFFNFFNTVEALEGDDKEDEDDEDAQKQEERLNIDYDIARTLVDEVIPYSLEYYLNVKVEDDEDFDDEDDIEE